MTTPAIPQTVNPFLNNRNPLYYGPGSVRVGGVVTNSNVFVAAPSPNGGTPGGVSLNPTGSTLGAFGQMPRTRPDAATAPVTTAAANVSTLVGSALPAAGVAYSQGAQQTIVDLVNEIRDGWNSKLVDAANGAKATANLAALSCLEIRAGLGNTSAGMGFLTTP